MNVNTTTYAVHASSALVSEPDHGTWRSVSEKSVISAPTGDQSAIALMVLARVRLRPRRDLDFPRPGSSDSAIVCHEIVASASFTSRYIARLLAGGISAKPNLA